MGSYAKPFAKAMYEHAGTIVFGTTFSFVSALLARAGFPDMTSAPGWVMVTGLFVTLVLACFRAWRDERRRVETAETGLENLKNELSRPIFRLEVPQIGVASSNHAVTGEESVIFTLVVAIRNLGSPSVALGYRLRLFMDDGSVFEPMSIAINADIRIENADGQRWGLEKSQSLGAKTAENPIARGGRAVGVLAFVANGRRHAEFAGTFSKAELYLFDVNDEMHSLNIPVAGPAAKQSYMHGVDYKAFKNETDKEEKK